MYTLVTREVVCECGEYKVTGLDCWTNKQRRELPRISIIRPFGWSFVALVSFHLASFGVTHGERFC